MPQPDAIENATVAGGAFVGRALDSTTDILPQNGASVNLPDITAIVDGALELEDDPGIIPDSPTLLPLPWVDDYVSVLHELTSAPPSFHRLGALVVLAMAVGDRARLRMSYGDILPNIYGALIGESSAYYKTTVLRGVRGMLTRALLRSEQLPAQFTAEGLTRGLKEQPRAVIVRDELSTLFAANRVKYLQFLKQDLTALFDGDPYGRLKAGESQDVDSPYLCILGATTPEGFYSAITAEDWRSGFLARWLFALPDGEPDFDSDSRMLGPNDEAALAELARPLIALHNRPSTDFTLSADAHATWNVWRKESRRAAFEFGGDVVGAITSRYITYALKLALLLGAVTNWGTITPDNMTAAIALADTYKTAALRLFTDRRNHGTTGAKLQRVFMAIQRSGNNITTKDLLQALHLKSSELQPVLDKLLEVGAIVSEPAGRGYRYSCSTERLPVRVW